MVALGPQGIQDATSLGESAGHTSWPGSNGQATMNTLQIICAFPIGTIQALVHGVLAMIQVILGLISGKELHGKAGFELSPNGKPL